MEARTLNQIIVLSLGILLILIIHLFIENRRMKVRFKELIIAPGDDSINRKIKKKHEEITDVKELVLQNRDSVVQLNESLHALYCKHGIVHYNAFPEMGGKMSFSLAILDQENTGFVFSVLYMEDGCYPYIKEITHGQSYLTLSDEETEAIQKAEKQML